MKKRILSALVTLAMGISLLSMPVSAKTEFVAFDVFANLNFEKETSYTYHVGKDPYDNADDDVGYQLVTDGVDEWAPQSGRSAVYIGGTHYVSIWGGQTSFVNGAREGELITGTYWLKVMQQTPGDWRQPRIRIYMNKDGKQVDVAKNKNFDTYNVVECVPYEWTQLELESTGTPYEEGYELGFEIINNSARLKFMIDNVQVGAMRTVEDEEPDPTIFEPYNIYSLFDFEDASKFHLTENYSGANSVQFKYDDLEYRAYKGKGAVYIDLTKGPFSFWSSTQKVSEAEEGSIMEGYFMFKLMQPHYDAAEKEANGSPWFKLPNITIRKGTAAGAELCYFNPLETTVLNYEPGVWYKIPIKSTGETFGPDDLIYYSIESYPSSGIKFMLDDLKLGRYVEVEEDDDAVNVSAAPEIEPYSGYNSDFESATGSAIYKQDNWMHNWGMWVPNQDTDQGIDGFNYIYDTNQAYSGTAMLEVVRGASAWSLDSNISEKVGDIVGGSFMLYVSEDCNLNNEIPHVRYIYKLAGDDTEYIAAQSPQHNNVYPVSLGWNRIPILPTELSIPAQAVQVGVIVIAPAVKVDEVPNVPYPGKFYIDNIQIGEVKKDLYISGDSKVTFDGETANCDVIISNGKTDNTVSGSLGVAVYENEKLIGINLLNKTSVSAKGKTGFTSTLVNMDVPAVVGNGEITVSAFFWDTLAGMTPLCLKKNLVEAENIFPYNDENIAYIGRWQDKDTYMNSYWGGAYFKTEFSGNSVKLSLSGSADIYVSVDGGDDVFYPVAGAGVIDVTPAGLENGTHTLRVASKYTFDSIKLKGIILNKGEALSAPEVSDVLIEFIGDSNTAGYLLPNNQLDNYSWMAGEFLGEHVHIAYTGMALSDGIFNTNINRDVGMSEQFFKPGPMDARGAENWDFSTYTPDIVCINLGGNDANPNAVPGGVDAFESTLPVFLSQLRAIYPTTEIVVLMPTTSGPQDALRPILPQVVANMNDTHIHYYDAHSWISGNLGAYQLSDNVHLSLLGNAAVAEQLVIRFMGLLQK